jgi:Nucleotidyl transferase AbiEii toxin, Type IV TA system
MSQYQTGAAFRRALEDRLRSKSVMSGVPLARLRKTVAFDRFLARLIQLQPDQWVLKGGFAIELRLLDKARTTKDIDVLALAVDMDILSSLRSAGALELDDWFQFEVRPGEDRGPDELGGLRFHIRSLLDGRTFEEYHLDVGIGDPVIDPVDYLEGLSLLDFMGISPVIIPCYPITQQIGEKLHAYTRPHVTGERSRVKDFVDILLLAGFGEIDSDRLLRAIHATFKARGTHSLPEELPEPPPDWSLPYQKLAAQVSIHQRTLEEANSAIKEFLNPLLRGNEIHLWVPEKWAWN